MAERTRLISGIKYLELHNSRELKKISLEDNVYFTLRDIFLNYEYIDDIFRDWIREENISKELNPRISDWGDVDREKMNKDIKSYLTRYLGN